MFYMFPYPISKKNAEILAFFGAYSIGPPPNSRHPKTIKSADGGTLGSMKCSYSLSSSLEAQTVFFRGFEGEVTGIGGGCIPVFFLCRVDLCIYIYLFIYIYTNDWFLEGSRNSMCFFCWCFFVTRCLFSRYIAAC